MSFEYLNVDAAIAAGGLRMVVVGGVPSPWGEAAKGILHIERIPWTAVRLVYDSEALLAWTGQRSAPVAVYGDEPPRHRWDEILRLAERLAPAPSLLPTDAGPRAEVLAIGQALCGEGGLGWSRRVQLIHAGMTGGAGFLPRVSRYLAPKYGHSPQAGEASGAKVVAALRALSARLAAQQAAGSPYLVGDAVSAADVYSAAFMALFKPLPPDQCAMDPATRAAFETLDDATAAALAPALLAHRDMVYAEHLELPLSL